MQTFPNCQVVRPVGVFPGSSNILPLLEGDWGKANNTADNALLTRFIRSQIPNSSGHWRAADAHTSPQHEIKKKVPLSFYPTHIQLIKHGHLYFTHKGKTKTGPGMIILLMWGEAELLRVLTCLLYTKLCLHEHRVCAWKHCRINLYVCFLFDAGKSPSTKHCAC